VRRYLAEFLSDPRVIALPRWFWLPILHGIVLNLRPARSAEKYALIWTAEGSPLAVHTARQAKLLSEKTGLRVEFAMRYGEPAIDPVRQFDRVVPLYPQYSDSATGSVLDLLPRNASFVKDFHDHPAYIEALSANVRRHWQRHGDGPMLVMSFHGLPKRGAEAYAAQCRTTATLLADRLRLNAGAWRVTFQSRFGFAEWLQPYTQATSSAPGSFPTALRRWRKSASRRARPFSRPAAASFTSFPARTSRRSGSRRSSGLRSASARAGPSAGP